MIPYLVKHRILLHGVILVKHITLFVVRYLDKFSTLHGARTSNSTESYFGPTTD